MTSHGFLNIYGSHTTGIIRKWFTLLWLEDLEVIVSLSNVVSLSPNAYSRCTDVGGEVLRELVEQGKHQVTVLSRKVCAPCFIVIRL